MNSLNHGLLIFTLVASHIATMAQSAQLFMLTADNDLFAGLGQDGAYTSGVRLDYLLEKHKSLSRSIIVDNFRLQHILITPNDISSVTQEPGDYPYPGFLSLAYSLALVDARRQRSITTESVVGILGPYAFAGEIQRALHKFLGSSMCLRDGTSMKQAY